jgi:hypothetical protein
MTAVEVLVSEYLENGGKIVVGEYKKPRLTERGWNYIRADVAYRGGKAKNLRNLGYSKANKC